MTAACVFLIGVHKPQHNWDGIGYVASAYQADGYSGQALLRKTYADLRADVSADTYSTLTGGGEFGQYRAAVATDPKALSEQLPPYSSRVVYVGLIRLARTFLPSYTKATYVISATFAALSTVVLARLLLLFGVNIVALPFLAIVTGITQLASLSTPDSFALFVALLCVAAAVEDSPLSLVFAAALPLIRTDFIFVSVLVLSLELLLGKRVIATCAALLFAIASYVVVTSWSKSYGLLTLINVAMNITPYPAELRPSTHLSDYAKIYLQTAMQLLASKDFLIYFVASYLLWTRIKAGTGRIQWNVAYATEQIRNNREFTLIFAIPMLYLGIHLLLFPNFEARYFTFNATLVSVWILSDRTRSGLILGTVEEREPAVSAPLAASRASESRSLERS